MAKVLLGVTGSVAAIKTRELFELLEARGHEVRIVATQRATYFFHPSQIRPIDGQRNLRVVILDDDEWLSPPYERGAPVLHIELRRWADALLIAPLDANTLAKLAAGICDNCLTCVWRAWEIGRPIILAPAMNTLMWDHPTTSRHLRTLADDFGVAIPPDQVGTMSLIASMNNQLKYLTIVPPVEKELACGDVGLGGMAPLEHIAEALETLLQNTSGSRAANP